MWMCVSSAVDGRLLYWILELYNIPVGVRAHVPLFALHAGRSVRSDALIQNAKKFVELCAVLAK